MVQIIRSDRPPAINFAPKSIAEEIVQNVHMLLSSHKYDIPLAREMGLSSDGIGKPLPVAESLLYRDIMNLIEEYEPRAEVVRIEFEQDNITGLIIPIVEVTTADE
ncbi:MAG: hypothetical protein E7478_07180 [Ruminococcaceae bacterium]|nr:hypothetical protein [Oscillospiraceae bacterium]